MDIDESMGTNFEGVDEDTDFDSLAGVMRGNRSATQNTKQ
jgi:hypothetical protein